MSDSKPVVRRQLRGKIKQRKVNNTPFAAARSYRRSEYVAVAKAIFFSLGTRPTP